MRTYEIVALIGQGGMGEVYRARDTMLRRDVALKILPPVFAADADRRARFSREAHVLATLSHPHIASIHGLEEALGIQRCYTGGRVNTRRFAIAVILAVCLGGPVVEMFDQWDHTLQDGNDTEANVVIVALCIGIALSVAGIIGARIRAMSSSADIHLFAPASARVTPFVAARPIPTSSPPALLRV